MNLFEGSPTARQSDDSDVPISRFQSIQRELSVEETTLVDELKAKATELESLIAKIRVGRYRALAITALEECVMWAVKEVSS